MLSSIRECSCKRIGSIRSVLEIAGQRSPEISRKTGLALLRSLGSASPDESAAAPESLPLKIGGHRSMTQPAGEAVRLAIVEVRKELGEALAASVLDVPAALDPLRVPGPRETPGSSHGFLPGSRQ